MFLPYYSTKVSHCTCRGYLALTLHFYPLFITVYYCVFWLYFQADFSEVTNPKTLSTLSSTQFIGCAMKGAFSKTWNCFTTYSIFLCKTDLRLLKKVSFRILVYPTSLAWLSSKTGSRYCHGFFHFSTSLYRKEKKRTIFSHLTGVSTPNYCQRRIYYQNGVYLKDPFLLHKSFDQRPRILYLIPVGVGYRMIY